VKVSTGFFAVVIGSLLLAAIAPALINLSHALLPLIIVIGFVVVVLRLVFFHTRRW
jgi:hypothetical protein